MGMKTFIALTNTDFTLTSSLLLRSAPTVGKPVCLRKSDTAGELVLLGPRGHPGHSGKLARRTAQQFLAVAQTQTFLKECLA